MENERGACDRQMRERNTKGENLEFRVREYNPVRLREARRESESHREPVGTVQEKYCCLAPAAITKVPQTGRLKPPKCISLVLEAGSQDHGVSEGWSHPLSLALECVFSQCLHVAFPLDLLMSEFSLLIKTSVI